jgi:hypothetical protein
MLDRAAEPDEAGTYAGLGRPEWDALLLADLQGRAPVDRRKDDRPSLLGWQFRQRGAHHVADVTPQYLTSSGLCSRLIIAEAAKSSGSVGTARRMRSATMVRLRVMVRTHDVTEPRRWSNTGAWRQTRMSASWATSSATEASLVMEYARPNTRRWYRRTNATAAAWSPMAIPARSASSVDPLSITDNSPT